MDLIRLNEIAYDNLADFSDEFKRKIKKGLDC